MCSECNSEKHYKDGFCFNCYVADKLHPYKSHEERDKAIYKRRLDGATFVDLEREFGITRECCRQKVCRQEMISQRDEMMGIAVGDFIEFVQPSERARHRQEFYVQQRKRMFGIE